MTTPRELLDREIGTPPPSTIDVDALIAGQRRRGRLRTAGLSGLVTAMVLTIGGVLVAPQRPTPMEWEQNAGASATPEAIPSATPTGEPEMPPATRSPRSRPELAAGLTGALEHAIFPLLAPEATFSRAPENAFGQPPGEPLVFVDYGTYFAAAAVITDGTGSGTITVVVGNPDTQFRAEGKCPSGPPPLDVDYDCEVVPTLAGVNMLKSSSQIGENNYLRFYVEMILVTGTGVSIEVTNGVLGGNDPYRAQRRRPVLSLEQAALLAQNPSLLSNAR